MNVVIVGNIVVMKKKYIKIQCTDYNQIKKLKNLAKQYQTIPISREQNTYFVNIKINGLDDFVSKVVFESEKIPYAELMYKEVSCECKLSTYKFKSPYIGNTQGEYISGANFKLNKLSIYI